MSEYNNKTRVEDEDVLLSSAIEGVFLNSELFGHQRGSSNIGYKKISMYTLILSTQNLHLGNANVNTRFEHGMVSPAYKTYEIRNCNKQLFSLWIKSEKAKRFFYNATTVGASQCRRNVEWDSLYEQEMILPSLAEQQKIADFLSLVDERIEKQRQLVEVLKRYKRGCFIYAYSQYPTNSYCIKDLGKMLSTGTLSKDDIITDGKYRCILYGELFTRYAEIIAVVDSRTNKMPTCMGKPNDILFPTSTTVDALSLISPSALRVEDVSLGGDMFVIRINENHDNRFVSYLINYVYKKSLAKYAQGTTIIHLHYTDIRSHVLTLPKKTIQQKIADFMDELEQTIIKEDKILTRLQTTKSALLQQMFI